MKVRRLMMAVAIAGLAGTAPSLQAQRTLGPGVWETFYWQGIGTAYDPPNGFFLAAASPVRLRITDVLVPGDAFQLYINSILRLTLPVVPTTGADLSDPDAAFLSPDYSHGELILGPGNYDIGISTYNLASGYEGGVGFIRADAVVTPEPVSMLLFGTGAAALALARRRRRPAR